MLLFFSILSIFLGIYTTTSYAAQVAMQQALVHAPVIDPKIVQMTHCIAKAAGVQQKTSKIKLKKDRPKTKESPLDPAHRAWFAVQNQKRPDKSILKPTKPISIPTTASSAHTPQEAPPPKAVTTNSETKKLLEIAELNKLEGLCWSKKEKQKFPLGKKALRSHDKLKPIPECTEEEHDNHAVLDTSGTDADYESSDSDDDTSVPMVSAIPEDWSAYIEQNESRIGTIIQEQMTENPNQDLKTYVLQELALDDSDIEFKALTEPTKQAIQQKIIDIIDRWIFYKNTFQQPLKQDDLVQARPPIAAT